MNVNNVVFTAESVSFEFSNDEKPQLFQSKIFEALKIVNCRGLRAEINDFIEPPAVAAYIWIDPQNEVTA